MNPIYVELEASLEQDAGDVERRIIAGAILPYGVAGDPANVNGEPRRLEFAHGSLEPARARTPLVLGHDVNRPVGVLAEDGLENTQWQALARFRVDETPDGDAALAQAASGSRASFSVGATLIDYADREDGVIHVTRAALQHVGLVAVGAFAGAEVASVAAEMSPTGRSSTVEPNEQPAETPAEPAAPAETPAIATATPAPAERPVILAERRPAELVLEPGDGGRFVAAMLMAANGDRDAIRVVEAALSVIDSTAVPGIVPVAHTNEILNTIETPRPLADRVAVRRSMPDSGMELNKPSWTTRPNGGWVAENAAIPSNAVAIGTEAVAILEWAWGIAMSYAVATRSSPDAIETIYRAAVQDFYSDVEQKLADAIMAVDQPTAAGAGLGGGVANFYGDMKAGPNVLLVAPDIFGDLIDAEGALLYSSGAVDAGGELSGNIAGLEVVVSPHLPAGTEIVTRRGMIELRETTPVRLTANVIGALQVELGVTAFASFDVEFPDAFHSLTPPAGSPSSGRSEAKRTGPKSSKRTSSK